MHSIRGLILIPLLLFSHAFALAQCKKPRPVLQPLRYDEDWSLLADPDCKKEVLDDLKHISLGRENWFLSIGGEIRYRYENYENAGFDTDPESPNGYAFCSAIFSTQIGMSGGTFGSLCNFKVV